MLSKITTPMILGMLFYFCIVPMGIFLKILKLDILSLKFDKSKASYWIEKEQMDVTQSMRLQF
jgi:hypothetical protein